MAFPESVAETCELLADNPDMRVIAGGTAVTIVMKEGVYHPDALINIRGLEDDLRFIRSSDDEVRIGALSTLRDIERHDLVTEHFPAVEQCLEEIAGVRVRNSATIGGHLGHADIHLDLPPVLAGYGAEVVLSDGTDERRVPLEDFMVGYYETAIEPGELITEVALPIPPSDTRGTYLKHRYFSEVDWPCVGVAAFAEGSDGALENVRVLLNSVSPQPIMRVEGVEDVVDPELTEAAIDAVAELAEDQARPTDDIRGSASYKERMAGVFTRRALADISEVES